MKTTASTNIKDGLQNLSPEQRKLCMKFWTKLWEVDRTARADGYGGCLHFVADLKVILLLAAAC
jgi:dimeric dUTPase (all-alpha-NTP-PPase superfamily)